MKLKIKVFLIMSFLKLLLSLVMTIYINYFFTQLKWARITFDVNYYNKKNIVNLIIEHLDLSFYFAKFKIKQSIINPYIRIDEITSPLLESNQIIVIGS